MSGLQRRFPFRRSHATLTARKIDNSGFSGRQGALVKVIRRKTRPF
jgi:hypothetical protein